MKGSPIDTLHRRISEANKALPRRRARDTWVKVLIAAMAVLGKGREATKLSLALSITDADLDALVKKYGCMSTAAKELLDSAKQKNAKGGAKKDAEPDLNAALKKIISALEAGTPLDEAQQSKLQRVSELLAAKQNS